MAAPPPVLTLAVEKGPRKGETRQCRAGAALRVGRVVKGNDLAVRDSGASQCHLSIECLPPPAARWAVSDLGSSNGTLLNGVPLVPSVPAPLSHGDIIKIGEATVLAVSIAPDSDPNPVANPVPRRSSRQAAAPVVAEEEKPPVATRRGARKKAAAAAEPPEAEKEKPAAATIVLEEEKPPVATRRGGRKKAAAAEPPEAGKEELEEAAEAPRRGRRKKAAEPPEPEKEHEEREEEAPVMTLRGGRKKVAATAAPSPLPPKTRSRRGCGQGTAAGARKAVLEEDEQEAEELDAPRERTENPPTATVGKDVEEEKEESVATGDGEVQGAVNPSEEEVPVARGGGRARRAPNGRANAQPAASDNVGEEEKGGGEEGKNGKKEVAISGGVVGTGYKKDGVGRSNLEKMSLGDWFDRMEIYLPRMINEAAEQLKAELRERHRRANEYYASLPQK